MNNMETQAQTDNLNTKLSAIDKALAAAQARKAAKEGLTMDAPAPTKTKVKAQSSNEDKTIAKAAQAAAREIGRAHV